MIAPWLCRLPLCSQCTTRGGNLGSGPEPGRCQASAACTAARLGPTDRRPGGYRRSRRQRAAGRRPKHQRFDSAPDEHDDGQIDHRDRSRHDDIDEPEGRAESQTAVHRIVGRPDIGVRRIGSGRPARARRVSILRAHVSSSPAMVAMRPVGDALRPRSAIPRGDLVGAAGFEPTTTSPPDWCATRLRHAPTRRQSSTGIRSIGLCEVRFGLTPRLSCRPSTWCALAKSTHLLGMGSVAQGYLDAVRAPSAGKEVARCGVIEQVAARNTDLARWALGQ